MTETAVLWAQEFATLHHVFINKRTYGPLPYTHHLQDVALVLVRYDYTSPLMQCGAWLHDVIEDCPEVKHKHLVERFGEDVANLVSAVTDEPGENRLAKKAATYPKIRRNAAALPLKLADRIANMENGGPLLKMYQDEHEDFRRNLIPDSVLLGGRVEALWHHLDALADGSASMLYLP